MEGTERFEDKASEAGAVYDRAESLRRLRGSEDLLQDMAHFFHEDAPKLLAQLKRALLEDDCRVVSRVAHTLRGLAATFDAHAAVDAAARLEGLGNQNERQKLPAAAHRLEAEVQRLDHALAEELLVAH